MANSAVDHGRKMNRACKISLRFATVTKRRQIDALLQSYRSAVNFYIRLLWGSKNKKDAAALAKLQNQRLSERYKQAALKQAFDLVISTKKTAKASSRACSIPIFKGKAIFDSRHIIVENGKGSFDLVVRLSTLAKGKRITLPTKHTAMTRKWLSKPNAKFIQGCALGEDSLILWVDIPAQSDKRSGKTIGVDIGVHKLIADSDGNFHGEDFKKIRDKIRRKKPESKAKQRAVKERDNFIGRAANQLPWEQLKAIGVEDLKNMKTGKKKGRGKNFRKAMAPWTYRRVLSRIENKASENRVHLIKVNPRNTSRTCPICGMVSKENRKGENFNCIGCHYKGDSDVVGAKNILAKTLDTLGSLQSPRQRRVPVAGYDYNRAHRRDNAC